MDTPAIVRKKRGDFPLARPGIFKFFEHYMNGDVPDYQCAALLMAIYFRGLDAREIAGFPAIGGRE